MKRRSFISRSATALAAAGLSPSFSIGKPGISANEKLNIAMIGAGGIARMAYGSLKDENIVAVCDVDERFSKREGARSFTDFRVMLDKMWKEIDGVCVNTPDHTHYHATLAAIERDLHVCTQKPLTHDIWQARRLRELAKEHGVVTNMGNQGHTYDGIRRMREFYEAGILGDVEKIICGFNGPRWNSQWFRKPESMPMPGENVPSYLDWDLWIGPAEMTAYNPIYHPKRWRGFWNYGSGQLGDWFCHIGDGPVWILDLYKPTAVECIERKENLPGVIPDYSIIRWEFPRRGDKAACVMDWHDGMRNGGTPMPRPEGWGYGDDTPQKGSYWYGSRQNAYLDQRSNNPRLVKREDMIALKQAGYPEEKYPRVKARGPHGEWAKAIRGGPEPGASFDYAAALTETCLLGVLAQRFGGRIEWDAEKMEITNRPELNAYVKEPERKGWVTS